MNSGMTLDTKWERLKSSTAAGDKDKEGLRGTFHGGSHSTGGKKKKQAAVIELLCDHDRTGLEGVKLFGSEKSKRDGDKAAEDLPSLTFVSYITANENEDVLHMTWKTKHACEDNFSKGGGGSSSPSAHWGFFTWLLIIIFLATAAYLVFGSWLNYSKNGARGWDLLPHSDTIRDVPYLLRDWARRVIDTFSSGGSIQLGSSRGGYAAV